jgi:hypothetical protein
MSVAITITIGTGSSDRVVLTRAVAAAPDTRSGSTAPAFCRADTAILLGPADDGFLGHRAQLTQAERSRDGYGGGDSGTLTVS